MRYLQNADSEIVLLLGYFAYLAMAATFVLSIGPASWALARYNTFDKPMPNAEKAFSGCYIPVATAIIYSPKLMRSAEMWYVSRWMPDGTVFHDDWPEEWDGPPAQLSIQTEA